MWIKKQEYEDMKNIIMDLKKDVDNLKILNRKVKMLERLHEHQNSKGFHAFTHDVDTKTITDLTIEELAKYVIDGTPIKREDFVKVKKIYK